MLKKLFFSIVSVSVLFLSSCGNDQGEVDEVMLEVLENGDSVVIEALEQSEIDGETKFKIEAELKRIIAELTSFEEEAIRLMISLDNEPSCSIVLPTEKIVEDRVIVEINNHLISKLVETYGITIDEESIVITNSNNVVLSE